MVVDELDALRNADVACQMVAFADLSAAMILVTDSATNKPREVLDALCLEAATLLGSKKSMTLGQRPSDVALWSTQSSVRIFLRAAQEPNDVLCCVCGPDVDVDKFMSAASSCLDRISNG